MTRGPTRGNGWAVALLWALLTAGLLLLLLTYHYISDAANFFADSLLWQIVVWLALALVSLLLIRLRNHVYDTRRIPSSGAHSKNILSGST